MRPHLETSAHLADGGHLGDDGQVVDHEPHLGLLVPGQGLGVALGRGGVR